MLKRNSLRRLVLICSLTLLASSGCSGLTSSDKPAVTTWWLKPYTGVAMLETETARAPLSVSIKAIPGLDTDRILALTSDAELKPYASARWTENLPELTRSMVVRTLTGSGRFDVMSGGDFSTAETCRLNLELSKFFANLDAAGQTDNVEVAFEGRLQCPSKADVWLQLEHTEAVQDQRMKNIVASFQRALDAVMKQMLLRLEKSKSS